MNRIYASRTLNFNAGKRRISIINPTITLGIFLNSTYHSQECLRLEAGVVLDTVNMVVKWETSGFCDTLKNTNVLL